MLTYTQYKILLQLQDEGYRILTRNKYGTLMAIRFIHDPRYFKKDGKSYYSDYSPSYKFFKKDKDKFGQVQQGTALKISKAITEYEIIAFDLVRMAKETLPGKELSYNTCYKQVLKDIAKSIGGDDGVRYLENSLSKIEKQLIKESEELSKVE